eukprot:GFYU01021962.1.p1 GENE.GFYU01021962.1~~GFYU01021962.1.p1  ORF type:complete len:184 (+),score=57.34 GFYU01021962.1:152-703(+)
MTTDSPARQKKSPPGHFSYPYIGFGLAFCAWWLLTTWSMKLLGIVAAGCFSCIEYTWYSITTENEDGSVSITPFAPTCRKGHTTWDQFYCNVLYTPILLLVYRLYFPLWWLRIAVFPFNVWLLEIVEGYFLMWVRGHNTAWYYMGASAFCHGNINIDFIWEWYVMGAAVEFAFTYLVSEDMFW